MFVYNLLTILYLLLATQNFMKRELRFIAFVEFKVLMSPCVQVDLSHMFCAKAEQISEASHWSLSPWLLATLWGLL